MGKNLFSDFLSFTQLNSDYYINYFKEKEESLNSKNIEIRIELDDHLLMEILMNFKKIINLFLLGFIIPGRPPHENLRTTFAILFKGFQLAN